MTRDVVDAVVAVLPEAVGRVEVLGDSALAESLRERLGTRGKGGGARPVAVLDTTGDPLLIQDAMARVDDLGTVILAGPPAPRTGGIDLYSDVHVRGLTVIGLHLPTEKQG